MDQQNLGTDNTPLNSMGLMANDDGDNNTGVIKCRIDLDNRIYERYLEVKNELKKRNAGYFGISQFLEELLTNVPKEFDSKIIEKRTPLEFKVKNLLENDENRRKLEKLLSKL
jgi:hypothetical protein